MKKKKRKEKLDFVNWSNCGSGNRFFKLCFDLQRGLLPYTHILFIHLTPFIRDELHAYQLSQMTISTCKLVKPVLNLQSTLTNLLVVHFEFGYDITCQTDAAGFKNEKKKNNWITLFFRGRQLHGPIPVKTGAELEIRNEQKNSLRKYFPPLFTSTYEKKRTKEKKKKIKRIKYRRDQFYIISLLKKFFLRLVSCVNFWKYEESSMKTRVKN